MHTLLFSLRRGDLTSLAWQRALLKEYEITPARYLMLHVIRTNGMHFGEKSRFMQQRELGELLGVTKMTVSVMVRALVDLGLLVRTRAGWDRRQWLVRLTPRAIAILNRIQREVIKPGVVWWAIYNAMGIDGRKVGALKYWLDHFRKQFDDPARFYYAWCALTLYRRPDIPPKK